MNRENIIAMAREAGFRVNTTESLFEELERFAALVFSHALVEPCCGNYDQCQKVCMPRAVFAERERIKQANAPEIERVNTHIKELEDAVAAEREACAELCEMLDVESPKGKSWDEGTIDCANAIRARGQA